MSNKEGIGFIEHIRIRKASDCTQSVIKLNGYARWVAIEDPWTQNKKGMSCIPTMQYFAKRYNSPKYGPNVWEITNVTDRTYILVHAGNTHHHTQGCILLGCYFGFLNNEPAVLNSKKAMDQFMKATADYHALVWNITEV